jgi:hypothetical protein
MAQTRDAINSIAYGLAFAMAHDVRVTAELRTRPVRKLQGKVRRRWIDSNKRIDPKSPTGART